MINDLPDDTTLYVICHRDSPTGHNIQEAAEINMRLNASKIKEMLVYFGKKPINIAPVAINGIGVARVKSAKLVGMTISQVMTCSVCE